MLERFTVGFLLNLLGKPPLAILASVTAPKHLTPAPTPVGKPQRISNKYEKLVVYQLSICRYV